MGAVASQITSLTIVYSIVYSDADQRKHQSSASLAFVQGIHWGPVNSPHKWPVARKMFPFDDAIMKPAETMATSWDREHVNKLRTLTHWPLWDMAVIFINNFQVHIKHRYIEKLHDVKISTVASLFVQQVFQVNIKALHYWPFVRGIHRSPLVSPHKVPVMQKSFPCYDVIMIMKLYRRVDLIYLLPSYMR